MRVLIAIKKNILNKIIVKNWTDLVSHLYYLVLDIREYNPVFRKYSKKIRVINLYDNKIDNGYIQ